MRPATSRLLIAALAVFACSPAVVAAEGSWTGFHAGLDLGLGQYEPSITDVDYQWYGGTLTGSRDGGLIGVHAGYDKQFSSLVVGGEVNWTYANIEDHYGQSAPTVVVTNKVSWLASLRARGGLAVDRSLLYIVAGIAKGDFSHEWSRPATPNNSVSKDNNNIGVVLGIGLEHQVTDRIAVRAELTRYSFGDAVGTTPNGDHFKFRDQLSVFDVGVSYRF